MNVTKQLPLPPEVKTIPYSELETGKVYRLANVALDDAVLVFWTNDRVFYTVRNGKRVYFAGPQDFLEFDVELTVKGDVIQ